MPLFELPQTTIFAICSSKMAKQQKRFSAKMFAVDALCKDALL